MLDGLLLLDLWWGDNVNNDLGSVIISLFTAGPGHDEQEAAAAGIGQPIGEVRAPDLEL